MEIQMHSTWDNFSIHPCLACGEKRFDVLFSALDFDSGKEPFQLTMCNTCRLVRTEPISSDSELEQYYNLPYYGDGKKKFINLAEAFTDFSNYRRARSILSQLNNTQKYPETPVRKILDIGCGRGTLLKILKRMRCECYGLERAEFPGDGPDRGIHFYSGKLIDISFEESFFDTVIIWHVIEHVDDPILMIQETARILRPGGVLVIAVPNFGSFQAGIFRESWFHLDLPRHRYHFTPDILLQLLDRNGFNIINWHTFSIEQNPFGFIQSFFNKIMPFAKPNRFYSLLKNMQGPSSAISFLLWAILTILVFPFALLEYLISGLLGKGATVIIYAKKC
jgi:SAM-dependent methyltransferase